MLVELRFLVPATIFLLVLVVAHYVWGESTAKATSRPHWVKELMPAAVAGLLGWAGLWLVERLLSVHFLAGGPEENVAAEASSWAALAYFIAMVVGMLAQTIWHALQQRQANSTPVFDKWEFVKPALVAPIVFIAVYQNISQVHFTVVMLLFSFQNGFFWQTVLRSNRP
jgi:hypothetical protein